MRISRDLLDKICRHGEQAYPEECCGIMLGDASERDTVVKDIVEIENSQDENRRRRFLVTPEQYRRAEGMADERGMSLLGFYHTHPDHPAAPSAFDTDHALPWFTYVIMSVVRGQAATTTAWVLQESRKQFDERPLEVFSPKGQTAKEKSWQ